MIQLTILLVLWLSGTLNYSKHLLDYKEPKTLSARQAHLIPPEDSNEIMLQVISSLSLIPRQNQLHLLQLVPPSPLPDVIPDNELLRSNIKPLLKKLVTAIHANVCTIPEVPPQYLLLL